MHIKNRQKVDENRQKFVGFRQRSAEKIPENKEKPRFLGVFFVELVMGVGPIRKAKILRYTVIFCVRVQICGQKWQNPPTNGRAEKTAAGALYASAVLFTRSSPYA